MICKLLFLFVISFIFVLFIIVCVVVDMVIVFVVEKVNWLFIVIVVGIFDELWVMSFLFDGSLLVSEKCGVFKYVNFIIGISVIISGVFVVVYGGQGGFGDVLLYLDFVCN